MQKVAIVFLNYKNYKDTIEAVDSVLFLGLDTVGIIIVDNGSDNLSYPKMRRRYRGQDKIFVLRSKRNLGFANGNNIGITYARNRLKADFVLVANNDTLMLQKDYLDRLLNSYTKGTGIIASDIKLPDGSLQEPIRSFTTMPGILWFYFHLFSILTDNRKLIDYSIKQIEKFASRKTELLHGCVLLMTPDFFNNYSGFYTKTFLYCEEELLYMMCRKADLRMVKADGAVIYHKEGQASAFLYDNRLRKKVAFMFNSYKWVILYNLMHYKKCNYGRNGLIHTKAGDYDETSQ